MPSHQRRYGKPRGNSCTEVVTAFGVDGVVDAVAKINKRTRTFNYYHREDAAYAKARSKVTLPADVAAWLNKEVV
jgi:hypothetical protein